jgi:AraC family transcriptional regulator
MLYDRVTGIKNGQVTPLRDAPVLSTSYSRRCGFLLESHIWSGNWEESGWSWHNTHVGLCTGGRSEIQVSGAAGSGRFIARAGSVFVFPRGCGTTSFAVSAAPYEFVVIEIDDSRLQQFFQDEVDSINTPLLPQLYIREPRVEALIRNMHTEVEAGYPSGPLYTESLSLALAAYLYGRYAATASVVKTTRAKFTRAQAQQVLGYIDAHLDSDFSLVELAGTLRLSPRQFSRLFHNTFETSPHRYLLEQRVARARQLLARGRLSVAEIAACLGFASQSHFTEVFRRAVGMSPRRYQRAR